MWKKLISGALLLFLFLPLWAGSSADSSLPSPATMTETEIVLELQEIFNRQQTKLDSSQTVLPKVLQIVEGSQKTSEKLQVSLGMLSRDSRSNQETLIGLTSSFQNYSKDMEKQIKKLAIKNEILFYTVLGLAIYTVIRSLVAWPP